MYECTKAYYKNYSFLHAIKVGYSNSSSCNEEIFFMSGYKFSLFNYRNALKSATQRCFIEIQKPVNIKKIFMALVAYIFLSACSHPPQTNKQVFYYNETTGV